jgi:hypothetical protein
MKIGSGGAIKQRRIGASGASLGGLVGTSIGLRYTLYFSTGDPGGYQTIHVTNAAAVPWYIGTADAA